MGFESSLHMHGHVFSFLLLSTIKGIRILNLSILLGFVLIIQEKKLFKNKTIDFMLINGYRIDCRPVFPVLPGNKKK